MCADALPRDCFAHFDASDEASLSVYRDEGGDTLWFNGLSNLVSTAVNGKAFYLRCYASCRSEVLKDCPSRGLNVIDLGDMTQYGGRYLQYTTEAPSATETNITERLSLSGVTTMVAAFHARGTGPSLADAKAFERKWLATYNAWHNVGILRTNECDDVRHLAPTDGVAFVNGLKVDPAGRLLSPGFQVVAVQTPGAGITRFGINSDGQYRGGAQLGELFLYRRPLSETELRDVSAYLLRKWLGRTAPGYAEAGGGVEREVGAQSVVASAETEIDVSAGRSVRFGALGGEARIVKTGAGALSVTADATVGDLGAFAGAVSVSGGATLALANATPKVAPALATEGRIAHFDMSDASTLTLEEQDGYVGVAEWRSKVGDGVKAVCGSKYFSALSASMPRYMANSLNGMPTMLLYQSGSNFMLFEDAQGVTNDLVGIKTVFWVLGTANGRPGGFLLGGGRAYNGYFWHRGGSGAGAYRAEDPLTCKSASRFVWGGRWWKDGVSVDGCAEGLDANSWHYLCFQPAEGETGSGYATGFAFDGRIIQGTGYWNNFRHRTGNQNLAEVIIYDRVLTEEERLATETHLAVKWGLLMSGEVTCGVEVASGATVDLGGNEVAMTSVTGGGAVSNGTLTASALVADAAATSWPAVDGTFRIAPGQKVAFANLPQGGSSFFDVKILSAKAFEGTENLASAVFEGVPDGVCARLRVRDGYLVARHGAPGTVIVVR